MRCLNWPNVLHAASSPSTERVQRGFLRPEASDRDWPDAPSVRSTLCTSLPHRVFDRTHWSCDRPNTAVKLTAPAPRAPLPLTGRVRSYHDRVRSLPVTSVHLCFYPRWLRENFHYQRSGKYAFHFHRSAESRLASLAGGREGHKPISTAQTPPPSQMC
jgi:hypothetical protein